MSVVNKAPGKASLNLIFMRGRNLYMNITINRNAANANIVLDSIIVNNISGKSGINSLRSETSLFAKITVIPAIRTTAIKRMVHMIARRRLTIRGYLFSGL